MKKYSRSRRTLQLEMETLEPRQMLAGDITGFIFSDTNANGTRDPGESGLNGWAVYVDSNRNGYRDAHEVAAETTTSTGFYRLRNVDSREQLVRIEQDPRYEATNGGVQTALVRNNQTTTAVNFGQQLRGATGSISGFIFEDTNSNNRRNAGEPGLNGWTVYADLNGNGTREAIEPTTTTDTDTGFYRLDNLVAGGTTIRVESQEFHEPTFGTGRRVTVRAGQTITNTNFGKSPLGTGDVTGFIFSDTDADGIRDPGESGLVGFTVYVDSNRNGYRDPNELNATTTTSTGFYRLSDVAARRQMLRIEQPSTHVPTGQGNREVVVRRNTTTTGVNFGQQLRRTGSVTGFIFSDTDADGYRDAGESGLVGWMVYVDSNRNGYRDQFENFTTTTTTTGFYRLTDVNTGAQSIRVERRTTHAPTTPRSILVNVASNQNTSAVNFGLQLATSSSIVNGSQFPVFEFLLDDDDA